MQILYNCASPSPQLKKNSLEAKIVNTEYENKFTTEITTTQFIL